MTLVTTINLLLTEIDDDLLGLERLPHSRELLLLFLLRVDVVGGFRRGKRLFRLLGVLIHLMELLLHPVEGVTHSGELDVDLGTGGVDYHSVEHEFLVGFLVKSVDYDANRVHDADYVISDPVEASYIRILLVFIHYLRV